MAQVPYTSFFLGPYAVYTSPSGMISQVTGIPYLGGTLHEGDYCDLQASEAAQWNIQYGNKLYPGRYRVVRVSPNATAADFGFGVPVGWGLGTNVANAIIAAAGSGYTITATGASSGTVSISSSAAGGTAAVASLNISGGALSSVQITYPGANMTSVPTFTLSSVLSSGSGGSLLAEQFASPNFISSLDGTSNIGGSIYLPRAIGLTGLTSAQVSAGAWIIVEEQGIAPVLVTTATQTVAGDIAYVSGAGGAVTTITPAYQATTLGNILDVAASGALVRCNLTLPSVQG